MATGCTTFNVKLDCAVRMPSLTVMLICALPNWPAAGVIVTVRFAALPPKERLPLGTNPEFDEAADSNKLFTLVSGSLIVKETEIGRPVYVVCVAIAEIVGGW